MSKLTELQQSLSTLGLDGFLIAKAVNYRYLTGFSGTESYFLITPENAFLLTDSRNTEQAKAEAPDFQVLEFRKLTELLGELRERYQLSRIGLEKEIITIDVHEKLQGQVPGVEFVPVADPVADYRRVKSTRELAKIRRAAGITDQAFLHILDYLRPGLSERDVALELEFYMRYQGAERIAFDFIVASGVRGAMPHGTASDKLLKSGEMVTMDIGCVYQGYNSDLTRTVFLGQPTERQLEIYNVVHNAQVEALAALKPGACCSEIDAIARGVIEKAGYGQYFGHGLGHGVGLEIHEGPRLSPQDDSILEAGMVVTVEPGIYIPDWGGVRIEDLVMLTPTGCEIISSSPKDIITIQ